MTQAGTLTLYLIPRWITTSSPGRAMSLFTTSATASLARSARFAYALPELGLDIKPPLLGENEEVTIVVAERPFPHGLVCSIDVRSESLAQRWVTVASDGFEASHEVGFGVVGRDVEGIPCKLGRTEVNLGVER